MDSASDAYDANGGRVRSLCPKASPAVQFGRATPEADSQEREPGFQSGSGTGQGRTAQPGNTLGFSPPPPNLAGALRKDAIRGAEGSLMALPRSFTPLYSLGTLSALDGKLGPLQHTMRHCRSGARSGDIALVRCAIFGVLSRNWRPHHFKPPSKSYPG